jgi:AraC-like DNA-binding protein
VFSSRVSAIISFINMNFREDISLLEISAEFNLAKSQLEKLFEGEVGVPIKKFVIMRRLYEAVRLLRSGKKEQTTLISIDVGFGDLSNFIRQFKRYVGCSPVRFENCHRDPAACELWKHGHFRFLEKKGSSVGKALAADISGLCYLNRGK